MNHKCSPSQFRLLRPLAGAITAVGLAASVTVHAAPQTGIPALLQFAEQYQQRSTDATPSSKPTSDNETKKSTAKNSEQSVRENAATSRWKSKEAEIQRQRITIARLERQVGALERQLTSQVSSQQTFIDTQALGKLAQGIRQVLRLTPTETQIRQGLQQAQLKISQAQAAEIKMREQNEELKNQLTTSKAQIHQMKAESRHAQSAQLQNAEQDKVTLQTHLTEAKKSNQTLTAANESLKAQLARIKVNETSLQEAQTQQTALQRELDDSINEVSNLNTKLKTLEKKVPNKIPADRMILPSVRQAYAAGVSLGEEVLQMHAERQKWGVKVDKQMLLAGLIDTFSGEWQLDQDAIAQALADSEQQVIQARENVLSLQTQQGDSYLAKFKKDKRVKSSAEGAWYRIDYAGDSAIPTNATLDVIVKETLTDGTVIQDMDASGAVLSQSLSQFPPLFAGVLRQLKNHGSLTLVVPPALAYGEKGYPPNIPPNATMVYNLRIAEIYPEAQNKKEPSKSAASSR